MENFIHIQAVNKEQNEEGVRLNFEISLYKRGKVVKKDILWYETETAYGDALCDQVADGAIVTLLPYAIRGGYDICSEIAVSEELYYNLSYHVIPQLCVSNKNVHSTSIKAPLSQGLLHTPTAVACGMSRGVDSFASLYEYTEMCELEKHRITHLTYFENGAHHLGGGTNYPEIERFFCEQLETTKKFCEEYNLKLIVVKSNVNVFLANVFWADAFDKTHTYRNVGMALVLQNLIGTYYYSSAYNIDMFSCDLLKDSASYEKWLIPHIRTGAFKVYSSNRDMSRLEKTRLISNDPRTYDYLSVCFMNNKNCGRCIKCVRTLLTLDMLGVLDKYGKSFDVQAYKNNRTWYYTRLYSRKDEFLMKELLDYAKSQNIRIPFRAKLEGTVRFVLKRVFNR